jgi:hypothetical protein
VSALSGPDLTVTFADHPADPTVTTSDARYTHSAHTDVAGEDAVYLQSEDDSLHESSWTLLAKHSSFFADLPPFLGSIDCGRTIIPLPSATATGLALVVRFLPHLAPPAGTDRYRMLPKWHLERVDQSLLICSLDFGDLPSIVNALDIARTYDIDALVSAFDGAGYAEEPRRPLFAWALSAITERYMNCDRRAMRTLRSTEVLPDDTRALLEALVPRRLERLLAIQGEWGGLTAKLWRDLVSDAPTVDGRDDYADRCKGMMGLFGCTARQVYPAWRDLRRLTGERVYEMAIKRDGDCPSQAVKALISPLVPCTTCAARLGSTLRPPLRIFWADSGRFKFT